MVEWNVWKGVWLLNAAVTFFLLMLLWLSPTHTPAAEAYGWFFLGFMGFFIVDLLILDSLPLGFVFKTITANSPSEEAGTRHPLQWIMPVTAVIIISVLIGAIWGGFYWYEITFQKKLFISVPNLFSTMPLTSAITAQTFDILISSVAVATVEESIWTGLMFPILWGIIFLGLFKILPEKKSAIIVSLIIAALFSGYLASNIFHSFVYSSQYYQYADAQQHFTLAALAAGITGNTYSSTISHGLHNFFAKLQYTSGTYSILPFEAYLINPDVNRTFPT